MKYVVLTTATTNVVDHEIHIIQCQTSIHKLLGADVMPLYAYALTWGQTDVIELQEEWNYIIRVSDCNNTETGSRYTVHPFEHKTDYHKQLVQQGSIINNINFMELHIQPIQSLANPLFSSVFTKESTPIPVFTVPSTPYHLSIQQGTNTESYLLYFPILIAWSIIMLALCQLRYEKKCFRKLLDSPSTGTAILSEIDKAQSTPENQQDEIETIEGIESVSNKQSADDSMMSFDVECGLPHYIHEADIDTRGTTTIVNINTSKDSNTSNTSNTSKDSVADSPCTPYPAIATPQHQYSSHQTQSQTLKNIDHTPQSMNPPTTPYTNITPYHIPISHITSNTPDMHHNHHNTASYTTILDSSSEHLLVQLVEERDNSQICDASEIMATSPHGIHFLNDSDSDNNSHGSTTDMHSNDTNSDADSDSDADSTSSAGLLIDNSAHCSTEDLFLQYVPLVEDDTTVSPHKPLDTSVPILISTSSNLSSTQNSNVTSSCDIVLAEQWASSSSCSLPETVPPDPHSDPDPADIDPDPADIDLHNPSPIHNLTYSPYTSDDEVELMAGGNDGSEHNCTTNSIKMTRSLKNLGEIMNMKQPDRVDDRVEEEECSYSSSSNNTSDSYLDLVYNTADTDVSNIPTKDNDWSDLFHHVSGSNNNSCSGNSNSPNT